MPTRRTFDKAEFLPNDNSKPHIVPDVLYPAIGGKLLDGTTSHSGNYGTAQSSDSRKYYYTDIKGSRPIRDPRIGAHFGSQRHKFTSLQLLEQETATHGDQVYSIDGREWVRGVKGVNAATAPYDSDGNRVRVYAFWEIVGYFIDVNLIVSTHTADREFNTSVDGGSASSGNTLFETSITSPLGGRYVDEGSVGNLGLGLTLGIHTLKVSPQAQSENIEFFGIELIAQDTTSAVTRNKIQFPSQTVFSFGSKFTVGGSSAATHYDPFSAKTDGTGWTSPTSGTNTPNSSAAWPSNIDTATSLGLAKWVNGSSYYRPYNGGRVVKWVDENGEIKTSVNVMPPNAKSIGNSGTLSNGTAKSNGSAPNDNFRPTFEAHTSSADEDLLSEVAKTFHYREFGNGAANGGTGATYADVSMLNTNDDVAYVMDDGLTSFSGQTADYNATHGLWIDADNHQAFFTFIGTGVGWDSGANGKNTWAQNLPYGTHIVHYYAGNHQSTAYIAIDGIQVKSNFDNSGNNYIYNWAFGGASGDITFHQPKMPPIPEGACIIADYMLMADFIPQTSAGANFISKGTLTRHNSRDFFYDAPSSSTVAANIDMGYFVTTTPYVYMGNVSGTISQTLPYFGTGHTHRFDSRATYAIATNTITINDSNLSSFTVNAGGSGQSGFTGAGVLTKVLENNHYGNFASVTGPTLGIQELKIAMTGSSGKYHYAHNVDVATMIHTSHHYKTFETPFLKELIGGDRNMEQTNLVCSPDGKTWDEVTRDTSYIGNQCISTAVGSTLQVQDKHPRIHTRWRGTEAKTSNWRVKTWLNKDFAIAYDRVICLKDGNYRFSYTFRVTTSIPAAGTFGVILNEADSVDANATSHILKGYHSDANQIMTLTGNYYLKRGDQISWQGPASDITSELVQIERVK